MAERIEAEYGAEQIQVLDGLEHIRKRPGMYISSTDAKVLKIELLLISHYLYIYKKM